MSVSPEKGAALEAEMNQFHSSRHQQDRRYNSFESLEAVENMLDEADRLCYSRGEEEANEWLQALIPRHYRYLCPGCLSDECPDSAWGKFWGTIEYHARKWFVGAPSPESDPEFCEGHRIRNQCQEVLDLRQNICDGPLTLVQFLREVAQKLFPVDTTWAEKSYPITVDYGQSLLWLLRAANLDPRELPYFTCKSFSGGVTRGIKELSIRFMPVTQLDCTPANDKLDVHVAAELYGQQHRLATLLEVLTLAHRYPNLPNVVSRSRHVPCICVLGSLVKHRFWPRMPKSDHAPYLYSARQKRELDFYSTIDINSPHKWIAIVE